MEEKKDQKAAVCPICKAAAARDARTFPFCGERCRKIDLGRWISGNYVISRPIEEKDLEEG